MRKETCNLRQSSIFATLYQVRGHRILAKSSCSTNTDTHTHMHVTFVRVRESERDGETRARRFIQYLASPMLILINIGDPARYWIREREGWRSESEKARARRSPMLMKINIGDARYWINLCVANNSDATQTLTQT